MSHRALRSSIRQVRQIEATGKGRQIRETVPGWPPNLNCAVQVLDQMRRRRSMRMLERLIKEAPN